MILRRIQSLIAQRTGIPFRPTSVHFKIALGGLASLLVLAAALMFYYAWQMGQTADEALTQRAEAIVSSLAGTCEYGLVTSNHTLLRYAAFKAQKESDVVAVTILDARGAPVAAAGRPETGRTGGAAAARRANHRTIRLPVIRHPDLIATVDSAGQSPQRAPAGAGESIGEVELVFSTASTQAAVHQARLDAWLITCGLLIVLAVPSQWAIRSALRPLRQLVRGTERLARGDWTARVPVAGSDEIGELAQAFNHLAGALERSQAEILDYQRNLEQRVTAATAQLQTANEQLTLEIAERKRLQDQYLQAQKVEAIGRLAGGVAHDFNNMLTAITGYSELLLRQLSDDSPLRRNAEQIERAAYRAGRLTRQLLAYSRKQMLQPRVLNLNSVVTDLEKMLRRIIGENVELHAVPGPDLGNVKADPGQIEQVILNLVVNSRDAMSDRGVLTIATNNVHLSGNGEVADAAVPAGDYVVLSVTDTGSGMSPEVKRHLFEPFFTTKPAGEGTGLGLATCFGVIKQSDGHIAVESETGRGTTIRIYLPRVDSAVSAAADEASPLRGGHEAILFVEDEITLRELGVMILGEQGYRVTAAENGAAALELVQRQDGQPIDLLVTDVVMPRMGGRELSEKLRAIRPGLRVLYTSGYTEDAIVHHGVLNAGIPFLQKPYTTSSLARKVREVLDA